jgi:pyrophosphate--fructose-6-phosphate 1-phosphotransferase
VYAELIGNIARDARSAGKYWHFVRLMGRSASHVTLECALATHPNVALVGEEIRERGLTLDRVVDDVARVVARRADAGRHYGVCLLPEGLVEFVPEMGALIGEINTILGTEAGAFDARRLSPEAAKLFQGLPQRIREQLLLDRDSHGNVQVSKIDTEALLTRLVAERYRGKLSVQTHFFGYEGRCAAPSNFDADYTWALGRTAAVLIAAGRGGTIASIGNLASAPDAWEPRGIPLTSLMRLETRKGHAVPVIAKALVRTDAEPFVSFARERDGWEVDDDYVYPGPIQYFGPEEVSGRITETLRLESR